MAESTILPNPQDATGTIGVPSPPAAYIVRAFDSARGVITVEWRDGGGFADIYLPTDAAGNVPTGVDLDVYVHGFKPLVPVVRTITNAPMIEALVEPLPPFPTSTPSWGDIRKQRDERLADSDWSVLPDVPMSDDKRAEWTAYRQLLRDITNAFASPELVVWPPEPDNPFETP